MIRGSLATISNCSSAFRKVIHTGRHCQLAVSCLSVGEELGEILYEIADQFLLVTEGAAEVLVGEEPLGVAAGEFVVIPAGVPFDVMNRGETVLKFLTVFSPPVYPESTVHETRQKALTEHDAETQPAGFVW